MSDSPRVTERQERLVKARAQQASHLGDWLHIADWFWTKFGCRWYEVRQDELDDVLARRDKLERGIES